jgi:hypothetical protein
MHWFLPETSGTASEKHKGIGSQIAKITKIIKTVMHCVMTRRLIAPSFYGHAQGKIF